MYAFGQQFNPVTSWADLKMCRPISSDGSPQAIPATICWPINLQIHPAVNFDPHNPTTYAWVTPANSGLPSSQTAVGKFTRSCLWPCDALAVFPAVFSPLWPHDEKEMIIMDRLKEMVEDFAAVLKNSKKWRSCFLLKVVFKPGICNIWCLKSRLDQFFTGRNTETAV